MRTGPATLAELRRAGRDRPQWLSELIQPEIGGGRVSPADLAVLGDTPDATALRISGLDQKSFERLVTDHGTRYHAIEFWKCPRITDLSPLEDLADLRLVSFFWNQRATQLWNLARTPKLTGLRFDDFTRLHDLDGLRAGTSLDELAFGDAIWSTSTFLTLEPVAELVQLKRLGIRPKRIDDARVQPLGSLSSLESLDLPTNLFSTEQLAWLRAHLPHTQARSLEALVRLEKPLEYGGKSRDVLLVGKRKPYLSSEVDAKRIEKHTREFDSMVERFRNDPNLEPS